MRIFLLSLLVVILTASSLFAVRLRYFNAEYDPTGITVTWEAEMESDVRTYELYRKSAQEEDFSKIAEASVHGVNVPYTILDNKIYKTSSSAIVDYRLDAVLTSGLRQRIAERKVNYTPTAIPRSWVASKRCFKISVLLNAHFDSWYAAD